MNYATYNIAAVERDTGLSKDVLRMWERRYGFPRPERDGHGERLYPSAQVDRLRQIKRLLDQGHRPGKLLAADPDEFAALVALAAKRRDAPTSGTAGSGGHDGEAIDALLALIRAHDAAGFVRAMQQTLARNGLSRFVQDTVAPLTHAVGDAWEAGRIEVYEEHLYTELAKRLLRQAIAALPAGASEPRVLLTSVPDEQHVLGLLMVESLLALDGAECVALGPQMPLLEIARAAAAHRAHVVALSFSAAYAQRQVPAVLAQLRAQLPAGVELWVGGAGAARVTSGDGVRVLPTLADVVGALNDWRADRH
jgi:methanogenic corrinoid protein MtbC1